MLPSRPSRSSLLYLQDLLAHAFAKACSTETTCLVQSCDVIYSITYWVCWFSLPITERPGHAYSEMFPVSPLPMSSKRLLQSVHPSAGPQHIPLLWLYHANPFMHNLAWISLLISNCTDVITVVYVCVWSCNVMQWNAAK